MKRTQIVDQLGQIFDAVDVVVHRWRNERRAWLRVAESRDVRDDFERRQLSALAGLRSLRDLDLQLVGRSQIRRGHAEPRGRDLLGAVAIGVAEAIGFLASLAAVAPRPGLV